MPAARSADPPAPPASWSGARPPPSRALGIVAARAEGRQTEARSAALRDERARRGARVRAEVSRWGDKGGNFCRVPLKRARTITFPMAWLPAQRVRGIYPLSTLGVNDMCAHYGGAAMSTHIRYSKCTQGFAVVVVFGRHISYMFGEVSEVVSDVSEVVTA